jgi:hypothetical protein
MLGAERNMIFISYRRDDSVGASGSVCDWLRIGFDRDRVFRDVASIGAGKWRPTSGANRPARLFAQVRLSAGLEGKWL